MKETELEQLFFEEIRFSSIVATAACFELRVHRSMRLDPDDYIDAKYGVRFSFDEVLTVGSDFTKAMASTVVYNILFHYGVGKLYPILRTAMEAVLKKHRGVAAGGGGAATTCCRNAKGWEGELVCRLNLWRKRQPIYTGAGCLAGMLAEHETRL
jgi:hypothetical protein